jgi:hypothetical protein
VLLFQADLFIDDADPSIATLRSAWTTTRLKEKWTVLSGHSQLSVLIAELIGVPQDPVNNRLVSEVFSGLLRFDPFVPFDFAVLSFQIFFQVHVGYPLNCIVDVSRIV